MGARLEPNLELVTIGDELLLGDTVDTNAAWLGRAFSAAGIRVVRRATVGDDDAAIRAAVDDALRRTGSVLCTGGLGPTDDDRTRPAVAAAFGRQLRLDPAVLDDVRSRWESRGATMPERNRVQAMVPDGARVFANPNGTAPGLALEDEAGRLAILLPGVPHELIALVEGQVLPFLEARWGANGARIRHRLIRTAGIGESALAEVLAPFMASLAPLSLASLPSFGGVDLRLTCWDGRDLDPDALLDAGEARIRDLAGRWVYATGATDLADVVGDTLRRRGLTVAVAESCTGGMLGARFTERAGASDYFVGGVIAYADAVKHSALGVPELVLARHGAVSEETARRLADGARRVTGADVAVAITGVAGPGGGTPEKPVGTVWIAVALGDQTRARSLRLPGDREQVRFRSTQAALMLLLRMLNGDPEAP